MSKLSLKAMANPKMTDMTVGSPVKHILSFALPLLIGNLFQQLYNMVDSIVVGNHMGRDAIAAVGTCGSMNFLFFSLSSGMATGIGVVVAQYYGAKDDDNVYKSIANSIYVLMVTAIIVTFAGILLAKPLLVLLSAPENVLDQAVMYMRTTCLGIISIALYNGVASVLRALGDSKTPLLFLIISSFINVILDLVFVLCFEWGVFGVAIATVIAQTVSAITSIIYAYRKVKYFHLSRKQMKPCSDIVLKLIRIGTPVALQNSMIAVSCMALQGVVNKFGETVMAAYTISGRIEQIVQQPYGSLGIALTNYSGQNMGAGQLKRVKEGFRKSILLVLIFSLSMIPIAYLLGEQIIGIFIKDAEVIRIGANALRITSLCYFGLGMIYVPRAVLNGCGDTGFAMLNGLTEVLCRILFSHFFTAIPMLGFWGIWITNGATWTTTAVVCVIRYLSGGWHNKSIVNKSESREQKSA